MVLPFQNHGLIPFIFRWSVLDSSKLGLKKGASYCIFDKLMVFYTRSGGFKPWFYYFERNMLRMEGFCLF